MAKGLGRGLQALLSEGMANVEETLVEVKIRDLRSNPYQPRKVFTEEAIEELAQSLKEHGLLQPIIVRKSIKGYEIVVGERRYLAAKHAGLKTIPALVRELSEKQMMELALIENLQRENLNPIEEANAYDKLINHLNVTQEQLATRLGKSRPHIANHLRLLQLPEQVQQLMSDGKISMGHGRALLSLKDETQRYALAEKTIQDSLNVRQLEKLIKILNQAPEKERKEKKVEPSPFIKAKEETLRDRFGTSVTIKKGKKKGKIEIDFFSEDDLERILLLLEGKK
ncbi:MAG TPA: ParB/RepB/Spo0J family partition protein [Bacilli bacterium]|nr:ParB/RepB/Spo0J family partition protein [Bacilli bacterium]